METHLHGGEAFVQIALRDIGHGGGLAQCAGRGIEADLAGRRRREAPNRLVGSLADNIPQREVERPITGIVERQVVEDTRVALDIERIMADEEVLELLEAQHFVSRRDAGQALIRVNAGDVAVKLAARARVPACMKRRVEIDAMGADLRYR